MKERHYPSSRGGIKVKNRLLALNRLWLFHLQANVIYEGGGQH